MLQQIINQFFDENGSVFKNRTGLSKLLAKNTSVTLDIEKFAEIFFCYNEVDFAWVKVVEIRVNMNLYAEELQLFADFLGEKSGEAVLIPLTNKEKDRLWGLYVALRTSNKFSLTKTN